MGRGRGRGRRRAGALAAVAVAAVLAAGCGASGERGAEGRSAVAPAQAAAGEAAKGDAAVGVPGAASAVPPPVPKAAPGQPAGQASAAPVVDARQIAYSAQLTVRTAQVDVVLAKARDLAVAAGGYVASETGSSGGEGGPQNGQITVKVPSAAFQPTLDQLAGLGEVLSRRSQAEDLTQQVADVNSRMQSQQASVDRVRALMAQAKTLAEIVSLESELSRREADLESLQKQVKELSARTSLSTVTLDVRQKAGPVQDVPDAPEDKGFWASVGSALGGGWHLLAAIVRGVAVTVAAVLPFLLVAAPVAAVLWGLRRRRRPVPAPAGAEPAEEGEEEEEGDESAR
ncbi:DUF4349 domain-containing protein [Kitasatospora purpeofusca]|uniref:DUF4349 domain-containing protein n=1 Tax=Kitasatospora purpeofusca TaxID=67352 RepID=UPI002A5A5531|nr:DUF4349 domain-containing protein [Kitasatospora purpeofusca]MDY0815237.1 DUF4349 domain-containing protein [Kitasatospora purpeofusca]